MVKTARWIGLFACTGMFVLFLILVFFNPYVPGVSLTLPIAVTMALSLMGLLVTLKTKPYLMLIIAIALFIPVGFYLLGTPGIFRWIGLLNIVFLLSALIVLLNTRKSQTSEYSR